MENKIKREPNVSITTLIGGQPRQLDVQLDPVRMAGYGLDAMTVARQLSAANQAADAGSYPSPEGQIIIHAGSFLKTAEEAARVVVASHKGRPVYLADVATIRDGPSLPNEYVFFGAGPAAHDKGIAPETARRAPYPAVTLALAKRKGTNAITVADKVLAAGGGPQGRRHPGQHPRHHNPQLR